MKRNMSRIPLTILSLALAFGFFLMTADEASAACRRGWRLYRSKSRRVFCCPPGTKGFYNGYNSISCRRAGSANRGRRNNGSGRQPNFAHAGRAGSLQFSFNSLQASAAVRRVKKLYFYRKKCRVVGLYNADAQKFRSAAAHIHRVISSRGFASAMHLHHRYYRRWERFNGSTNTILSKIRRQPWKVVINSFQRNRQYPCYDDKANGHTNAFANLGVGFVLLSKDYLRRASVRELSRTVIHESLHTLGFSHRGLPAWKKRYNNTVPPFVGCLVKHWTNAAYSSAAAQQNIVRRCVR